MRGKKRAAQDRAAQQPASQGLAAETAELVGDLAAQDRRARRRGTRAAGLVGGRDETSVLRSRLSALAAQAATQGAKAAGQSARAAGQGARTAGRIAGRGALTTARGARWGAAWLADQVLAVAPRLPVRDLATLRAQYPGRSQEELADLLISSAARTSGSVGAAIGTWAVLPFLPGMPAELAAETLTMVGIEIKLVAELHEVYGVRAPGGVVDRMLAYTAAWANRRGVVITPAGVVLAAGSPLRRRLQRRVAGRAGKSAFSLGPLLTGAAASAMINRYETRRLGREVRDDLRRRATAELAPAGRL